MAADKIKSAQIGSRGRKKYRRHSTKERRDSKGKKSYKISVKLMLNYRLLFLLPS